MKLLLDTHALLWYLTTPEKLPAVAHRAIQSADNEVYASLASAWEIAIKVAIGRLEFDAQGLERALPAVGVEPLGISFEHTARVANLPPHHHDPFDRMLVAQALCESMILVSRDRTLARYGVKLLWERP
ncbi:MAG: type II toxin-antitoxin system VapC family toxin [Burkholderiales bacterium]